MNYKLVKLPCGDHESILNSRIIKLNKIISMDKSANMQK